MSQQQLPPSTGKIHPVFHISLLEPYHLNNLPGRHSPTPPPVDLEETEYHVEKIRTSELRKGRVWYLVSWKGYGLDDDTWELYENLQDGAAATVLKFHQDNPRKPRDPAVCIWDTLFPIVGNSFWWGLLYNICFMCLFFLQYNCYIPIVTGVKRDVRMLSSAVW